MAVMDLTREQPRPMDATLDGYVWLPRMLDKARAALAGTLGSYTHPCPVDHTCLTLLGVRPDELRALVAAHPRDEDALQALRARGIPSAAEARFDPQAVEDELQAGYDVTVRRVDELPAGASSRELVGADHGAGVTLIFLEAAPGEGPSLHRHPYQEILIVQEGEATLRLGSALRVVGSGEVVVVGAGQAHGFTNTGDGVLRQLDIHLSPSFSTEWLQDA